ncbi:MAG TPA: LPS export ABC transporter periplasmic protein LptC [Burkholderiales bacterium]|nr:LPS export ABC transporter periplasmic protein LptC [Burkholderiales bacterium]
MTVAPTRLFPLLVALVLAVLSYALERAVREGPSGPEPRRHDPDYIVDNLVLTGYGADGAVEMRVTADKIIHYPDDGTTDVTAPRVLLAQPGRPSYRARAARGSVADDGEEVFLYGDVVLIREADAVRPQARLETDFLHVVGGPAIARSDLEVRLQEGARQLAGRGMEYHHDRGLFILRDQVRGRFDAEAGPRQ